MARIRRELTERLRSRREEIVEALLTRTYAIADPKEAADPEYEQGLRAAVSAALEYGLATVERGEEQAPEIPVLLLAQARLAARNGIPLDTVLRRYFAGYTLLGDFIFSEADAGNLPGWLLKDLLRDLAVLFDRFVASVTEEHSREPSGSIDGAGRRQLERVERLLDGEPLGATDLGYDFDDWNLGVLASGPEAVEAIRELVGVVDCRLLLVCRDEQTAWAWLGSRRAIEPSELVSRASSLRNQPSAMAFGEPCEGLAGWRLTHGQAAAALVIAHRGPDPCVRYADVAVVASIAKDKLLESSLRQIYLRPLALDREDGKVARETLCAYFKADRHVTSAAALLGVKRHTVTSRLRGIEKLLGKPIASCATGLEMALSLADLRPFIEPL